MCRLARWIPACGVVLVVQLFGASWLQAQQASGVTEGSRVRVSTEPDVVRPNPLITTLVRLTPDSLTVVAPSGGADLAIPNDAVARLEVSGGKQGRALRGLGIGMVAGTVVGGLAWALGSKSCEGELCGTGIDDAVSATFGAAALVAGALGGATIGLIIGAASPAERWDPLPLPDRSAQMESGRGYRVGLSIGVGSAPR